MQAACIYCYVLFFVNPFYTAGRAPKEYHEYFSTFEGLGTANGDHTILAVPKADVAVFNDPDMVDKVVPIDFSGGRFYIEQYDVTVCLEKTCFKKTHKMADLTAAGRNSGPVPSGGNGGAREGVGATMAATESGGDGDDYSCSGHHVPAFLRNYWMRFV